MPWRDSSPMDLKTQFIADYLRPTQSRMGGWIDLMAKLGP